MVDYDPKVIQKFAEWLYARARLSIILTAMAGLLSASVLVFLGTYFKLVKPEFPGWPIWACTGIGALIGWQRGFKWRVEAQKLLLLKRIEENTRPVIKE
jgi:hypothetical protein